MFKNITAQFCIGPVIGGILFAVGLGISGMTEPAKVIGFLDVFGQWDPSLMFVMVGAILVHAVAYRVILKRKSPLFEKQFYLPTKKHIDKKLIFGSAIFGIGWGFSGLCPGPGIVSLTTLTDYSLLFMAMLMVGTLIGKKTNEKLNL